jgi:hypothetical protein
MACHVLHREAGDRIEHGGVHVKDVHTARTRRCCSLTGIVEP